MRLLRGTLIVSMLALLGAGLLPAQTVTGTLEGHAQDSTGALMPNVSITVVNQETGMGRTTATNSEGFYLVTFLPLGVYRVTAAVQGFRTVNKTGVAVELNKTTVSDFRLEVSQVSETIDVTGETPQIETTTGELKGSIDARTIENTPLSGRNFISLMELVPEFQLAAFSTSSNNPTLSTGSYASFNGTGSRNTTFQIDGVNNDDSSENQNRQGVNVSTIREVAVITNSYSAEFGRGAGGVVLVQTKGGSNKYHGDAYEYLQNDKLAANGFFGNAAGRKADGSLVSPVSPVRRNQFGYTIGGPILKDRVFFFHSLEQTRFKQFAVISRDVFPVGSKIQVGECDLCLKPSEHPYVQQDQKWLQDQLDRFKGLEPNSPLIGSQVFTGQRWHDFPDQDYSGRFDIKLRQQDNLALRYQYSRQHRRPGELIRGETARQNNKQQAIGATLTHIFSPTLVGEFRLGLGLRTTLVDISDGNTTPIIRFSPSPYATPQIGSAGAYPINRRQNDYQYVFNVSKVMRRHTLKAGSDIRRSGLDDISDNYSRGYWTFGSTPASGTTRGYTAYENFLRGYIGSFSQGFGQFYLENRMFEMNYFAQEDYRLKPNFTLNFGARYEYVAAPSDVKNRITYGYNADRNNLEPRFGFAWTPRSSSGLLGKLTGGPGKSSVRGGYGLFHSRIFQSLFSQGGANLRAQPPYGIYRSFNATFHVSDPTDGFQYGPGLDPGRISILKVDPGFHLPYTQQANLTLERQLPWKMAVSTSYRWVRGIGIPFYAWVNRAQFPILSPVNGVLYDKVDPNLANTAPAAGYISISQMRTNERRPDVRYSNLLVAQNSSWSYYNAGTITLSKRFSGGLSFNTFYVFSKTIDTGSEATSQSDGNAASSEFNSAKSFRGLSAFHAAHRYVFNGNYLVPTSRLLGDFRQQRVGKVLDFVVGGWTVSGTYTAASGQPFSLAIGYDYNGDGITSDRPLIYDPRHLGVSVDNPRLNPATGKQYTADQLPASWFFPNLGDNPTVASRPFAPGTAGAGSIGRNTFFLQGMNNVDFALQKAFRVREGHSLSFRTEAYNLANRPQFAVPSNSILTSTFAQITGQRNPSNFVGASRLTGSRFVQMALRYTF